MEYVCIGVGSNQAHRTALLAYANAHSLPSQECDNGYICIGVGDGAPAPAHKTFLESYASAHNFPYSVTETPCS